MIHSAAANTSSRNNKLMIILRLVIVTGVIFYLVSSIDILDLRKSFSGADELFLLLGTMLLPLNIYLQYRKWELSCHYFLASDDKGKIRRTLFTGFSAAVFTPARTGEYLGRGMEFRDKRISDIASAVFFDKLYTLFFVILFGVTGALIFYGVKTLPLIILIFVILALLVSLYFLRNRDFLRTLLIKLGEIKFIRKVKEKAGPVKFPDQTFSIRMAVYSFLFFGCYLLQFSFFIAAFSVNYEIVYYTAAASVILLVKTIVPNFLTGELGIRESASVFFLSLAGNDPAAGFNASVFLFLVNIALPAAVGIFYVVSKKND